MTGTHQGAACTSTRVLSCAGANPHTKGSFRGNLVLRLTHTKVVIVHVHVRYPPPPALLVPPHHSANVPPCNVRIQPSGTQLIVGDSRLMPQGPASPPFRDEAPHTNGLTPLASAAPVPRGAHTLLGVGGLLMLLVWQHQHKLRPVMLPAATQPHNGEVRPVLHNPRKAFPQDLHAPKVGAHHSAPGRRETHGTCSTASEQADA